MKYPVSFELELKRHEFPGRFIAIEGIDGSGKTTQALELVRILNEKGVKALYTKEPTDGPIGQMIRKVLKGEIKMTPLAIQYLFCADRAEHQVEIEKQLKDGITLVTDRYFWSAVAYGIADINGESDFYLTAFSILSFYHRFISPDYTFFLDVDVSTAFERIKRSEKHIEIYDDEEKLVKIDNAYKKLIEKFKNEFVIINGNRGVDEITDELVLKLRKRA